MSVVKSTFEKMGATLGLGVIILYFVSLLVLAGLGLFHDAVYLRAFLSLLTIFVFFGTFVFVLSFSQFRPKINAAFACLAAFVVTAGYHAAFWGGMEGFSRSEVFGKVFCKASVGAVLALLFWPEDK